MKGIKKTYTDLNKIPELKYQGYVWLSNRENPEDATSFDLKKVEKNPFIQEALLFSETEQITVMVRHTGKYQISEFHLNELPEDAVLEEKKYHAHRLDEVNANRKLCIKQLWMPEEDPNCADMEVLTLKAHIFTGFSN